MKGNDRLLHQTPPASSALPARVLGKRKRFPAESSAYLTRDIQLTTSWY